MNCTKESIWSNFILKLYLFSLFVFSLIHVGISQGNSNEGTWQMTLDFDNYFSIRNAWGSNERALSVVVYDTNEKKHYALSLITISDEWNHFNFPGDFIALSEESKEGKLSPQDLIFEVRVKRSVEKRSLFFYDPSPNPFLQLDFYSFKERIDTNLVWGKFIDAYTWEDKTGENIIVRSQLTTKYFVDSSEEYKKYLYLYHFRKKEEELNLVRKFTDVYSGCSIEPNAGFSLPSIELTDLNRDTIGEISTIYDLYCTAEDTDTYHSKLLLTTDGKKFMLDATINPCAEDGERIEEFAKSTSFQIYPYLLRFMQSKLGNYHR